MVNSLVGRATSEMLMGADWAMNIEICDILNRDLSQSKDVVKGIKRRIKSKNAKVQLFALILLETIIKNCGEIIHLHIAEKEVLNEMVKIVKKKPEVQVKEKILSLIDIWQEAFGGPRARYPQFYAAYQDLLRMGAVFPQRSDRTVPVFSPPQTQPLASHPQNFCNPDSGQEAIESSTEAEFPTLSLSEIQNARGIMDVLAEMLNALDPANKEVVKQEVIVDLVEQCRTYKQRVVHLVNSTSDESLLCQGLALNDDLQRLLAKHEAIVSGAPVETEKPKSESPRALVDVDSLLIDTGDSKRPNQGSNSDAGAGTKLLPPAPIHNSQTTPPAKTDNQIDLLSGDSFSSPKAENSLALVPVKPAQPRDPVSQENALALVDMFAQSNNTQSVSTAGQTYYLRRQFQQQESFQSPQVPLHQNGSVSNMIPPQYEQSPYAQAPNPAWNNQMPLQQHSPSLAYGAESSGSLPPPPWEAQLDNSQFGSSQSPQPVQVSQVGVSHFQPLSNSTYTQLSQAVGHDQPCMNSLPVQGAQFVGGMLYQTIQPGQMAYTYAQQMYGNGMGGYGYGYGQQNAPSLEQGMSGLSMRDNGVLKNSSFQLSTASFVPYSKPSKPEDKLFGDLVDITKFKGTKATPARAGRLGQEEKHFVVMIQQDDYIIYMPKVLLISITCKYKGN